MKELDLTQGSVPKVLLHFAVPFLLGVEYTFSVLSKGRT